MQGINGESQLYHVETSDENLGEWRVVGPNGLVAVFPSQVEAQTFADSLNAQISEKTEDK